MNLLRAAFLALSCSVFLGGCASVPTDPAARAEFNANNDPLEPLNRGIFAFNLSLDRVLIKPLAKGYQKALPENARDALRHLLDNLNEPLILANTILQGRPKSAGTTVCRFLFNSTAGIGGLVDVASAKGLPRQIGDFGQTLWAWGFPEGPYLVLPVFGPSSPRNGVGMAVDSYFDPFRFAAREYDFGAPVVVGRLVIDGLDKRARNIEAIDEMQRESVDYYASLRSLYRQNRAAELKSDGNAPPPPPADLYEDPGR
jgi:phospholipid-binding lipoprotein MlaA